MRLPHDYKVGGPCSLVGKGHIVLEFPQVKQLRFRDVRQIQTTMAFLGPHQGKPIFHGRQRELDNLPLEDRAVRVEDVRSTASTFSIDREGFALVPHRSAVADFSDPTAVNGLYLRELEDLVRGLTGAAKAVAMQGGVIRRSERSPAYRKGGTTVLGRFAHCDFSPNPAGSRFWVERALPADEARERLGCRFAIFTVWRVLSDPPQDTPLALCDARTVRPYDQVCTDCVVDPIDGPGFTFENSVFRYDARQRWCFFSDMTRNEALVFKGFDSDTRRAAVVPHAAVDDPSCPSTAPPRESIDQRVIAFF